MHWSRFCLLAMFLGGAAVALQGPKDVLEESRPVERVGEFSESIEIHSSVADLVMPAEAEAVAGSDAGCIQIGSFATPQAPGTPRFRGNAYHVDKDVQITAIGMELGLSASVPLYVSIHQRQPNGSWVRYPTVDTPDIIIADPVVSGTNSPQFHFTAELDPPLKLLAGKDYAIGFAWTGASASFGNDVASYPQATPSAFDFGQVLGRFGINTAPPVADTFPILTISTSGAYSMQLCVSGACCVGGDCEDIAKNECLARSGNFTASGVTCAELAANNDRCPLSRGACCADDECYFINEYSCEALEGTWNELTYCDDPQDEPCEPRGGCCLPPGHPQGICADNQTVRSCQELLLGRYRGDNVACSAQPPCTAGACCFGQTCGFVATSADCAKSGGVFKGGGTSCVNNPCVPRGACCNTSTGVCEDGVSEPTCTSSGRSFRGEGSVCANLSPSCGNGACCITQVGCQDANGSGMPRSFCETTLRGTFRGDGTTCANINPRCPGTCCWGANEGTCNGPPNPAVNPEQCASILSGTFIDYEKSCGTPNPCSVLTPATGRACCLPHGACVDVFASNVSPQQFCENQLRGVFNPNFQCAAVVCEPVVPRGACCNRATFECRDNVKQSECSAFQEQWSQNLTCAQLPNPCQPRGACCNRATLACTNNVLQSQCSAEWTALEFCNELSPACAPTGACCLGTQCSIDTDDHCFAVGGTYQGDNTACDAEICLPRGACCIGQACTVGTQAQCIAGGGQYRGNNTTCEPDVCIPTGACCVDAACSVTTEANCPGEYRGDGTTCTPADLCVPRGACCVGGVCSHQTEAACTGQAGQYAGDDTACGADTCVIGACCNQACACTDALVGFACQNSGGQFHPGTDCATLGACTQHIVGSDPLNCIIDARQPHVPFLPAATFGIQFITVTMSCDATGLTAGDFDVIGAPDPTTITVVNATPNGTSVTLALSAKIPPQQYTCVRHINSGSMACVGYLPGDVDNDATTDPDDVLALTAGLEAESLPILRCDMDQTGRCGPLDILRNIDLQHGSGFSPAFWGGASIGAPCPSAGP